MSIFKESESYRPFVYEWACEEEKIHRVDMVWHEDQISLIEDIMQYTSEGGLATPNVPHEVTKNMLEKLLMLFTEMDSQVGYGYAKIIPHVGNNEIRSLLMTQAAREIVHQRGYALASEAFGFTDTDWSSFSDYVEMQEKLDLMTSFNDKELSTPLGWGKALATILLGEGISLFGAFAALLNLKRHGLLIGFNSVNEWSLRDEASHVSNNMRILEEVRKDLEMFERTALDIHIGQMIDAYVSAELDFIDLLFELGPQEGMTREGMKEYIKWLGDTRAIQLGIVDAEIGSNPLPWMDHILVGRSHSNFFEKRVADYSHDGLSGEINYEKYK